MSRSEQVTVLSVGVAVADFVMRVASLPEAAEKYRAEDAEIVVGGCAANAAVAVARLGGGSRLAARIGDDLIGGFIVDTLGGCGVDCADVRHLAGARSSFSNVLIDADGERQIVNYRGQGLAVDADWVEKLDPGIDAVLADTRWAVGADAAMTLAEKAGVPGIVDAEAPMEGCEGALKRASHVAYSEQGLRSLTDEEDLAAALAWAQREYGGFAAVTAGAAGTYWNDGSEAGHIPGFAVDAVDTLGAGDVWHGAFALALARGDDHPTAMRFANAAGAVKCTRPGGGLAAPTAIEVHELMEEQCRHN